MNLTAVIGAVEVLMSPLEWSSRDAWLGESLRRVRDACGGAGRQVPGDPVAELSALLHFPNDEPEWLRGALESPDAGRLPRARPLRHAALRRVAMTTSGRLAHGVAGRRKGG